MTITRAIEPGDRDAFRLRLGEFFEYAGNPWPGDEAFEGFFERATGPDAGFAFVGAFDDDATLVGIASVARVESSYAFAPFAYLDDVWVTVAARGTGVGRLLVGHVEGVARDWGASSILLGAGESGESGAFYEALGFTDMRNRLYVRALGGP